MAVRGDRAPRSLSPKHKARTIQSTRSEPTQEILRADFIDASGQAAAVKPSPGRCLFAELTVLPGKWVGTGKGRCELLWKDFLSGVTPSNYCSLLSTSWTAPMPRPCRAVSSEKPSSRGLTELVVCMCCSGFLPGRSWVTLEWQTVSAPWPSGAVCRIKCHILRDQVTSGPAGVDL